MNAEIATLADGSTIEYDGDFVIDDSDRADYFTADRKAMVCLFKREVEGHLERLVDIMGPYHPYHPALSGFPYAEGLPYAEERQQLFGWPLAIVVEPCLGLLIPNYPERFYWPHDLHPEYFIGMQKWGMFFIRANYRDRVRKLAPDHLGDFRNMMAITIKVARGIRWMHEAGLAHGGLSLHNPLIDPMTGSAFITYDESMFIPGRSSPTHMGSPGFVAPEVVMTQNLAMKDPHRHHPGLDTDRFALAALSYQYLLLRDPLAGPKSHDPDPAADELQMRGAKALFIEHPTDHSNRPSNLSPTITALGPELEALFLKAFVPGLHTPAARPSAGEWEQALMRTFHLLVPCVNPACEQKWFPRWSKEQPSCPFCGTLQ